MGKGWSTRLWRGAQRNEVFQRFGIVRGDRSTSFIVTKWEKVAAERIDDVDARFAADEHRTRVIPHSVFVAVEIRVECTFGDETQIECGRSVGAELPPTWVLGWSSRHTDHGLVEWTRGGFRQCDAVAPRAAAADGGVLGVRLGKLRNNRDARAVAVDAAQ